MEQRSYEWHEARRGKFTASEIHKLMGVKGMGKTGETYVLEKVAETLGANIEVFENAAMRYGTETEPFAKQYFMAANACELTEPGFLIAPWNDQAGSSPDGMIKGANTGIEIKCPFVATNHIRHMLATDQQAFKENHPEYYWQVMMNIAVTGADQWIFISFCHSLTGRNRMSELRITPDEKDIQLLKERIEQAVKLKAQILEILEA